MKRTLKILLVIIGVLLIFNGLINISDNDATILAYDITSILSGVGFLTTAMLLKYQK